LSISIAVSLALAKVVNGVWAVDSSDGVWAVDSGISRICVVWCNILGLCVFVDLSDFLLLLSDLDRVGFLWDIVSRWVSVAVVKVLSISIAVSLALAKVVNGVWGFVSNDSMGVWVVDSSNGVWVVDSSNGVWAVDSGVVYDL